MERRGSRTLAFLSLLAGIAILLPACTLLDPQADSEASLRGRLAITVADAQDYLWHSRSELLQDAEAALVSLSAIRDARAMAAPRGSGSFTLIEMEVTADTTSLTLMTSADDFRGGGLLTFSSEGWTCFILTLSHPSPRSITASPSDCTNARGFDRSSYLGLGEGAILVQFEELDARESVDATTYESGSCQCSSGGDCNCPGG